MKKSILASILAGAMLLSVGCGTATESSSSDTNPNSSETPNADIKVGVILLHDESIGYDKAHIDGIKAGAEANGISESQIIWKKSVPEDASCADAARDLAVQGCNIVITDSYGHQFHVSDVAAEYPDVTFVSMTGDLAASSGLSNLKNAFTNVYESRYISGVVAGCKLKELVEDGTLTKEAYPDSFDADGNIKIGYVGAFNYAEVVSGYTAFYLGVKSVVSNVVMEVEYTGSWADETKEAASATSLVSKGCVIIGQHADTTGAPAAIEKLNKESKLCFSVGYNISMLEAAPTAALTSASNNWGVYYTYAFGCIKNKTDIKTNWSEGYATDAVKITELGKSCAKDTQEKVDEAIKGIKDGTLHVFDTSKWTVKGETLTTYTNVYGFEGNEMISDGYFHESELRSAPCFDIRIDGITENAMPE